VAVLTSITIVAVHISITIVAVHTSITIVAVHTSITIVAVHISITASTSVPGSQLRYPSVHLLLLSGQLHTVTALAVSCYTALKLLAGLLV
jgi:hypothetical protein